MIFIVLLVLLAPVVLFFTCLQSPDSPYDDSQETGYLCKSCVQSPQAAPEHDNSYRGVYKGALTGSTGNIIAYAENEGSIIKALLVLDGQN